MFGMMGFSGRRARTISPLKISGLGIWLDAGAGTYTDAGATTAANNGDPVYTWVDQTGHGANAIQATASTRPALIADQKNGRPCLRFDGVDDFTNLSASAFAKTIGNNVSGITTFMVHKTSAASANFPYFLVSINASATGRFLAQKQAVGSARLSLKRLDADTTVNLTQTGTMVDASYYITNASVDYANAQVLMTHNGTSVLSGSSTLTSGNSDPTDSNTVRLLGSATAMNAQLDLFELLVWPRYLTSTEAAQVGSYLSRKYGI